MLLWNIRNSDRLKFFEELEAAGREVQTLIDRPELPSYAVYYYNIFVKLHLCRGSGFSGLEPIKVEAIVAYCMATNADFDEIFDIISDIDSNYRKDVSKHGQQSKANS